MSKELSPFSKSESNRGCVFVCFNKTESEASKKKTLRQINLTLKRAHHGFDNDNVEDKESSYFLRISKKITKNQRIFRRKSL